MSTHSRATPMGQEILDAVQTHISPDELLDVERACVRIPSPTFQEDDCARFFFGEMKRVGLDPVELMEVVDPYGSGKKALQPIGWLKGSGAEPSLMINGHMDHVPVVGAWDRDPFSGDFDGEWIYGRGAHDDKGGIVAAIGAVAAIRRAGVRLRGDVVVCPVMGHKSGGIGTRALLAKGIRTNYCINTESSGLGIATTGVGVLKFMIHARAKPIHFRQTEEIRSRWMDPFEQIAEIIRRLGHSMEPVRPGGWLRFEPDLELPGYPQIKFDNIVGGYAKTNRVSLEVQTRLVPGQSADTVRRDLEALLSEARQTFPNLDAEIEVPPRSGEYAGWDFPPYRIAPDARVVRALVKGHSLAVGESPVVGAAPRLGAVGDANIIAAHGVEAVQYGPGSSRDYAQWPTPNEKVRLADIVTAAKAMAVATLELCT
ncbi:MAG: M20 family metallopeptidase [Armatimonadota bacterium]